MDSTSFKPTPICHVVAMPYPGRGHINPMMNLCKTVCSKKHDILVTFVVTEEWLGFIGSDSKPDNIRFRSIPNVLPSELVRAADIDGFYKALSTKMEAPFEQLLDRLEPPPTLMVADTFLCWAVGVGNRRNIPVASFFPMSGMMFSVFQHFDLFAKNGHHPADLLETGDEFVDYIPGVSSTSLKDLPFLFSGSSQYILNRIMESFSWLPKSQYLLLTTIYELEPQVMDILRTKFSVPLYTIGPAIPYFTLEDNSSLISTIHNGINYLSWLDHQHSKSVLYISLGSYIPVSSAQIHEIAAGLCESGVPFLWVACAETSELKMISGDSGLIVPWCDQLRVLCHPSVGGFWSHCGWNSVQEGLFGGIPFITFPIAIDQHSNSKLIVEDWKIGYRMKQEVGVQSFVTKEEITGLVQKFMDLESNEGKPMRKRAQKLQQICQHAIAEGGSSESNINNFIREISCHIH